MNREEVISALNDLSTELERLGVKADLYLVGGAVIAVAYDPFRVTDDIDAMFDHENEVHAAADIVARERGLPLDWLNSSAFSLMDENWPAKLTPRNMDETVLLETANLTVSVPSARYLFLLKMLAVRSEKDYSDHGGHLGYRPGRTHSEYRSRSGR